MRRPRFFPLRVPAVIRKYRLTETNSDGDGKKRRQTQSRQSGKSEDKAFEEALEISAPWNFCLVDRSLKS